MNNKILFIAFTKSHYSMAVAIMNELNTSSQQFEGYIFCSGYLYSEKDMLLEKKEFVKYYFFNEHVVYKNKFISFKLRKLIKQVTNLAHKINPSMIFTFSDNAPLYQNIFFTFRNKSKVILFHEGYGDYSDVNISIRSYIGYGIQKFFMFPYPFNIITRSYTDYYKYSFLFLPDLVQRSHAFTKLTISKSFAKKMYIKSIPRSFNIESNSVFLVLSGRDWLDKKGKAYLLLLLSRLNKLTNQTYMKIALHQSYEKYSELIGLYDNIHLIDDKNNTSESYCFHNNFKYIITDESSSVVNALFAGMKKTVFFLNKEIKDSKCYAYDRNVLVTYLIHNKIIFQLSSIAVVDKIKNNFEEESFISDLKEVTIKEQLEIIIND